MKEILLGNESGKKYELKSRLLKNIHQMSPTKWAKLIDIFVRKHKIINMRTTLDLSDELLTEIKILAAQERVTLKDLVHEILRIGLRARQIPNKVWTPPAAYRSSLKISRSLLSQMRKEGRP